MTTLTKGIKGRISNCCKAPIVVVGHTTLHYECTKCGNSCDEYFPSPLEDKGKKKLIERKSFVKLAKKVQQSFEEEQEYLKTGKKPLEDTGETWEKEFDKMFDKMMPTQNAFILDEAEYGTYEKDEALYAIKDFIHSLLLSEQKRHEIEINKLKRKYEK